MRPIFNKACCCCTLETGGQIIGYLYAILGAFGVVGSIGAAVIFAQTEDPEIEQYKTALVIVFITLACFSLLNVAGGVLLILGVRKRNHKNMLLIMVLMVLGLIGSLSNFGFMTSSLDIISILIGFAINLYLFLIVLSLYSKIKNEFRGGFGQSA